MIPYVFLSSLGSFHPLSALKVYRPTLATHEPMSEIPLDSAAILHSSGILEKTQIIQRIGEAMFTASVVIAFVQAAVALVLYRTNPAGELIVPPGRTAGVEHPTSGVAAINVTGTKKGVKGLEQQRLTSDTSAIENVMFSEEKRGEMVTPANEYSRIINRFNRFMFLLLPWVSQQVCFLFQSQMHLLHLGFIVTTIRFFDFPATLIQKHHSKTNPVKKFEFKPENRLDNFDTDRPKRILVIGDSLAVGIGTVEMFDASKNQTIDYHLVENLSAAPDLAGPTFPRIFAAHLADAYHLPVHWRSAGVDGGTVFHIRKFCMDVVRQEVAAGHKIDCVVILCGLNDLKEIVSNPLACGTAARKFRRKLNDLLVDIKSACPTSRIVLPAVPAQMIRFNSPLNIFPLAFFLDAIVGFWESQKKIAIDSFPYSDVTYIDVSGEEVKAWYDDDSGSGGRLLIASDGIHPNKECYSKWATHVARRVVSKL